ncbi:MAG: ABC transporter permease [Spirochaetales bacterium]
MRHLIQIALRNLNRQKRRTFLLGGAIAFGITIVTLINGFAGSFVENVSQNFSQLLAGHIFVSARERTPDGEERRLIPTDEVIFQAIEASPIDPVTTTKRSDFTGALLFQGESVRQNIVGADWEEEEFLRERLVLLEGSFENMLRTNREGSRNGIILTEEIARRLNVAIDDRVIVRMETLNGQQNVGEFTVAAISYDPGLFGQLSAYADLDYVNELLLVPPGSYQTLGIFLEDLSLIDERVGPFYDSLAERANVFERATEEVEENPIEQIFAEDEDESWTGTRYRVYTLNDLLSEVDQIVDLLNGAALVILIVLFVIIMVGITNTFRMIMYERVKEIGTMRALGMQRGDVLASFLFEAMFLALGGVVAGVLVAGVAMLILSQIYLGLDSPIFILLRNGYFTFRLLPSQVALNTGIVVVLTVIAAFFPSRKAARMEPVDALRSV